MAITTVSCVLVVALFASGALATGLEDSNPQLYQEETPYFPLQNREIPRGYGLRDLPILQSEVVPDPEEYPPFQARLIVQRQNQDLLTKDKRASYMSLCHFKICNMGRKRSYWNTWPRA